MSETRHTPGPWKTRRLDENLYVNPARESGEYGLICKITGYEFNPTDRKEANARLISAAPTMLGVLEDLEKVGMSIRADSVIWKDIRAALDKARP